MKLCDLAMKQAMVSPLRALERDGAINELFDALVAGGVIKPAQRPTLVEAVLERERKGSTGFGKGVAVPHVKHASITRMTAAIGVSEAGIDFSALDRQPVYTIFLLLSPAGRPEEHLQAMEVIFKNLSNDKFRRFLRQAESTDAIWAVLQDADEHRLSA